MHPCTTQSDTPTPLPPSLVQVFHRRDVPVIKKAPGVSSMSGFPPQDALGGAA